MTRTPRPDPIIPPLRFTADDAVRANSEWGCNCGPATIAAVLGLTLDEVRQLLPAFRGFMNPTEMALALALSTGCTEAFLAGWPVFGVARIQWHGPWMAASVPRAARYKHTHYVASFNPTRSATWPDRVFDVNALGRGGWIPMVDWEEWLVPALLAGHKGADGKWSVTHSWEVAR